MSDTHQELVFDSNYEGEWQDGECRGNIWICSTCHNEIDLRKEYPILFPADEYIDEPGQFDYPFWMKLWPLWLVLGVLIILLCKLI